MNRYHVTPDRHRNPTADENNWKVPSTPSGPSHPIGTGNLVSGYQLVTTQEKPPSQDDWWNEEDIFDLVHNSGNDPWTLPAEADTIDTTDNALPCNTPADTRPSVLRAISALPKKLRCEAHSKLAQCRTIEDALAEMLAARNSGKKYSGNERLRVLSVLGLLGRLSLGTSDSQIFACMCLINMRAERNPRTPVLYAKLAEALPPTFPDELGPYKTVLIDACREAIKLIRGSDTAHFGNYLPMALDALKLLETKLQAYEREPTAHEQVSGDQLKRLSELRYAKRASQSSANSLKRTHEETVHETFTEHGGTNSSTEPPPLLSLAPPTHHSHLLTPPTQPSLPHTSPGTLSGPRPQPSPPSWSPARYAAELQVLAQQGTLLLLQPVAHTLAAFAACRDRQQLNQVMQSITLPGFLGMLGLMRSLNPGAAGEVALYTALYYVERTLLLPNGLAPVLSEALSDVKRLPDDVRFTFALGAQASQQPDPLRTAIETLFDRLTHRGGS